MGWFLFLLIVGGLYLHLRDKIERLENQVEELRQGKYPYPVVGYPSKDHAAGPIQSSQPPETIDPFSHRSAGNQRQDQQPIIERDYKAQPAASVSSVTAASTGKAHNVDKAFGQKIDGNQPSVQNSNLPQGKFSSGSIISDTPASNTEENSLEFKFGSKIFTAIGTVAVIFGISFFFKYAIDNELIPESVQIILGLLAGTAMVVTGAFLRKKYAKYGSVLIGGGLGVMYLSIFAAFDFYQMIGQPLAFVAMVLVTILGVALSVRYDAQELAIFAQLGGFLTPFLISTGNNRAHELFIYITVLDIGIVAIAFYKQWKALVLESYIGTIWVYFAWFAANYTLSQYAIAHGYASVFFLIFMAIFIIQHQRKQNLFQQEDFLLVSFNSVVYFLLSYFLLNQAREELTGMFTAILGLLHIALYFLTRKEDELGQRLPMCLAGIGTLLLILAVPIQFDRKWVTIGWAAEAMVLTYLGLRFKMEALRYLGMGIFMLTFVRLVLVDSMVGANDGPWLNDRMISFLFAITAFTVAAFLYGKKRDDLQKEDGSSFSFLLLLALSIFVWMPSAEILQFHKAWFLPIFWSMVMVGTAFLSFAINNYPARLFSFLLLCVTIFRLLAFDTFIDNNQVPVFNSRFFTYIVTIIASYIFFVLYQVYNGRAREDEKNTAFSVLVLEIYFLVLWLGSAEIIDFFKPFWLPIFWGLAALGAKAVAVKIKSHLLGTFSMVTLGAAGAHLLIEESSLDVRVAMAFLNTRVLSYLLVVWIIFCYLLVHKNYEKPGTEAVNDVYHTYTSLIMAEIYLLMAWVGSAEIIDFHARYWMPVYLSLVALAGSIAGFKLKSMTLKALGLATLCFSVVHLLFRETEVDLARYTPLFNAAFFILL